MRDLGVTFELNKGKAFGQKAVELRRAAPRFQRRGMVARHPRACASGCGPSRCSCTTSTARRKSCDTATCPSRPCSAARISSGPPCGLEPPRGRYLHLGGICLKRDPHGHLQVSSQHFGHATGVAYMVQNRRVLARVAPGNVLRPFGRLHRGDAHRHPRSVARHGGPVLRRAAHRHAHRRAGQPVLHRAFLPRPAHGRAARAGRRPARARRPRLPQNHRRPGARPRHLQPRDRQHARPHGAGARLVPGRAGAGALPAQENGRRSSTRLGSQLADDRALLPYASRIIRFYLGEAPILSDHAHLLVRRPRPVFARAEQPVGIPHPAAHRRTAVRQPARPRPQRARGSGVAAGDQEVARACSSRNPSRRGPRRCVSRRAARSNAARTSSSTRCARATASRCSPAR